MLLETVLEQLPVRQACQFIEMRLPIKGLFTLGAGQCNCETASQVDAPVHVVRLHIEQAVRAE